jgi:hypothetical protein
MDISDFNRIKLGDNWWFSVQPDKMIFGGSFLPSGIHCTFAFGLKSGFLDLHLRKDLPDNKKIYFPIVKISAKDVYECLDPLKLRLIDAVLVGLEEITENIFIEGSIGFIPLHDDSQVDDQKFINEILSEIIVPESKRRLNIDFQDHTFESKAQTFAEKYAEKWKDKIQNSHKIKEKNFLTGILIKKDLRRIFVKIFIGTDYKIFLFDSLDLDHISVLRKFLGQELYDLLEKRFNEGLEQLIGLSEPKDFEDFVLSLNLSTDE